MAFFTRFKRYSPLVWAATAVLAGSLSWFRVFELYELQTYDWRCVVRGARPVSPDIVLIDIWDDTLKALGAWPFDRGYHAELIDALAAHGVKGVAMDMVIVEEREGDDAVAAAAARAKNVYFVEAFYSVLPHAGKFRSDRLIAPLIPEYAKAARAVAHVNSTADMDGKRRRTFPIIEHEGRNHYQLSLRVAMDVFGVNPESMHLNPGKEIDFGGKIRIPLDEQGHFIVNYAGPWEDTFKHYSYFEVLAARLQETSGQKPIIDLEELRGKICFVGLTSLGSHDTNPVPIQAVYPMVGMHANVLNSLLTGDFIRRLDRPANLAVLALFCLWVIFLSVKLKPWKALGAVLATLIAYVGLVTAVFSLWGLWVDLFYPCMLFAALYAGSTLRRVMHETRRRELIEGELKIASQIQQSFLPASLPKENGVEIAVFMKPAKAVGGDLYSFVTLKDGKLGIMVGDVSGKGTPAALFMAKTVSEFKFSARDEEDPAAALARLNDSIAGESTGGLFVTLTYAIFDMHSKKVRLANAGHLPVVLVTPEGESALVTADDGMPIGVFAGAEFTMKEIPMRPGECFAFYSDGVSEARNRRKDEYGVEALQKTMVEHRAESAPAILEKAVVDLTRFMAKAEQHDDITLIVVKVGEVT